MNIAYSKGSSIIWADEIWNEGVQSVLPRVHESLSGAQGKVYLSVDMDVLDAAYAPGTCTPTPGGMTSLELLTVVRAVSSRAVSSHGLLWMDVVETAPNLDPGISTAGLAGRVVMDALACHAGALNSSGSDKRGPGVSPTESATSSTVDRRPA